MIDKRASAGHSRSALTIRTRATLFANARRATAHAQPEQSRYAAAGCFAADEPPGQMAALAVGGPKAATVDRDPSSGGAAVDAPGRGNVRGCALATSQRASRAPRAHRGLKLDESLGIVANRFL
jgi:hypothetical protein